MGASCADAVTITVWPMGGVGGGLYTPLALIVPSVAFPPKTGRPPTGPTDQRMIFVVPPVSVAVNVIVFALPDVASVTQIGDGGGETVLLQGAGEEICTVGAGEIVTAEVAARF